MNRERFLLPLVASLVFLAACANSRPLPSEEGAQAQAPETSQRIESAGGLEWVESPPVRIRTLPEGQLRLTFPPPALHPDLARLGVEEVRPLIAAFDSLRPRSPVPLRLLEMPGGAHSNQHPASWESRLREDFISLYGPPLLPVPESLEMSRLLLALQLSTRYMDDGVREAARERFTAPAFLVSVSLAITVYFAAWLAPEPFFSKGFAAALTVRLALLVGLVELSRLAHACIRLYQEAEAASSPQELEAASERFGRDGTGGASGGGPKLSTRYGKPHTRQNPAHNEAIEAELARREAAGHTGLKKNEAQVNAQNMRVNDTNPLAKPRFRKPDVSSLRHDGIRHNTNYVSNRKDLRRELDAFQSMVQADPKAIHELYLLDGSLVRRHVPTGVNFP